LSLDLRRPPFDAALDLQGFSVRSLGDHARRGARASLNVLGCPAVDQLADELAQRFEVRQEKRIS
jgi:hypothetical protein